MRAIAARAFQTRAFVVLVDDLVSRHTRKISCAPRRLMVDIPISPTLPGRNRYIFPTRRTSFCVRLRSISCLIPSVLHCLLPKAGAQINGGDNVLDEPLQLIGNELRNPVTDCLCVRHRIDQRTGRLDRRIKCRGRIGNYTVAFLTLLPEVPAHALRHILRTGNSSTDGDLIVLHLDFARTSRGCHILPRHGRDAGNQARHQIVARFALGCRQVRRRCEQTSEVASLVRTVF